MIQLDRIKAFVLLTRPKNSLAAALSFGVGASLASGLAVADVLAGVFIVLLVHSAATIQNDIYDQDVDRANRRKTGLLEGTIGVAVARRLVLWLYVVAAAAACVAPGRAVHVPAVALFIILAWLYNRRPILLSRRPVSSIVLLGLYYGALPLLYGYLLGGESVSGWIMALVLFWFLRRSSISILKDFKDAKGDKQHAKRTFYLVFGRKATAWTSIVLATAGYVGVAVLLFPHLGSLPALYVAPMLLALLNIGRHLHLLASKDEQKLTSIFRESFIGQNQFEALVVLCLVLSYN